MMLRVFDKVVKVHGMLGIPIMTARERGIYKDVLRSLKDRGPLDIFEYGSGFSTVYFAKFLKRRGTAFHLHSVDNNAFWHGKVRAMADHAGVGAAVTLHLRTFEPFFKQAAWDENKPVVCGALAPSSGAEEEYIRMPGSLGKKFDLIVVDGRFRRRCLEGMAAHLKPGGVIFLHDAEKKHYHASLSAYPRGVFIDGGKFYPLERRRHAVWVGGTDNAWVRTLAARYGTFKQENT